MLHVGAVLFKGRKTADKALNTIEQEAPAARQWVDDVAVISRGKHGFVRVNSTWAQNDEATTTGAGFGAITGGLIGAMMGPQGALTGALAGGGLYGLVGGMVDWASDDPRLDEIASKLSDDSSALVLVADRPTIADFTSSVEPFEATLIQTEIDENDVKALRSRLGAD